MSKKQLNKLYKFIPLATVIFLVGWYLISENESDFNLSSIISGDSSVRLISTQSCGPRKSCYEYNLGVTCNGIPERTVLVKERTTKNSKGAVLFTVGGFGGAYYSSQSTNAKSVVDGTNNAGYETFEISWQGAKGWGTNAEGKGLKEANCGFAEVAQWISSNKADRPSVMCATGNSGGSFQIGYGLSVYGLDSMLDMVVLTGGPPTSRLDVGCFGTNDPNLVSAVWPSGFSARSIVIDYIMGWLNNGDYCKNGAGSEDAVLATNLTSVASTMEARDYYYPSTKVNFVNSETDSTVADEQGRIYSNDISTAKAWYEIAGAIHTVHGTVEGSQKIKDLILNECKVQ